ncbi:MAG: SufE family protein [Bacteriovoracaceae bacterium]|nr:SufE family protein [Bacteriovoracaceae bacterium]
MNLEQRIESIKQRFSRHGQWEDRYREIIELGKEQPEMAEADKIDRYKVKGCQSQVWLKPEFVQDKVNFQADSDALLVKGIVSILVMIYSGATADEIIKHEPTFLKELGIAEHLSMNRSNGLSSMLKQIKMYAMAAKALANRG